MELLLLEDIRKKLESATSISDMDLFKAELAIKVNHLLNNNFAGLIQILYRIDIDEKKLKASLESRKEEPAGDVIADTMIQRVANTIAAKKEFKTSSENIDEDLKW